MIKKIVHKSSVPLYMTALTWILYAVFLPLSSPINYICAIAVTAVVGIIAKVFCKDIVEEIEVEDKPVSTGNPELDQMIEDGNKALAEMRRLNASIQDPQITDQMNRMEELTGKIFDQIKKHPEKMPQIRMFMNYYLPTTLKILNAYDTMRAQGISGENISSTMKRIEGMLETIVSAFEKQLDSLFGEQAMDISTDITVLEQMMEREGLKSDKFQDLLKETGNNAGANEENTGTAVAADGDIELQF